MIALKNVQLTLGGQRLFDGLDWQLSKGQRVGLVGPNGAGKSTLLKLICGKLEPEQGDVIYPSNLSLGYLAQEVPTAPDMTPWGMVTSVFESLRSLQGQMEQTSAELSNAPEIEHQEILKKLEAMQSQFEAEGGYGYEVEAGRVLSGLGVERDAFNKPMRSFSGGWRARVYLAMVLLSQPDVFLLDEPTNHLDIDALEWLTSFLIERESTMIVVSHDQWFLDRMCTHIAELSEHGLHLQKGNFAVYLDGLEERSRQLQIAVKKQTAQRGKLERFIERFGAKASKAKQAKSKMKQLEKMSTIQGQRASQSIHFELPRAAPADRVLLELKTVGLSYGSQRVLTNIDEVITKGSRIGIVGTNGAGKSTLVKLICGVLEPSVGCIERSARTAPYLYQQHQIDVLDGTQTCIEAIESSAAATVTGLQVRNALGAFGISGDDAFKKIQVLSGGEKARVALTKALMRPVNLIVLDEPTNHLDMPSKHLLQQALQDYDGTIVVISHDRRFLNQVCSQIWGIEKGRVHRSLGDYEDYQRSRQSGTNEVSGKESSGMSPLTNESSSNQKERRRQAAQRRQLEQRLLKPLLAEVERLERELHGVETELAGLEEEQLQPDHYEHVERMLSVVKDMKLLRARQDRLYDQYGEALDAVETARAELP